MKKFIHHISVIPATLRLWRRIISVQARLAILAVPDALVSRVRAVPPRRVVATFAVVLAVAVPSGLYVHERARSAEFARAYRTLAGNSAAEIATLRTTMGHLLDEQVQMRDLLVDAGYAVYSDNSVAVSVVATGYSSSVIETDNTPYITASNTHTRNGILAMSRDMLRRYNPQAPFSFGDIVHVSGIGNFIVEDSMNPRWRRRVDVWFPNRSAAFRFGRRRVTIRTTRPHRDGPTTRFMAPVNIADGRNLSAP